MWISTSAKGGGLCNEGVGPQVKVFKERWGSEQDSHGPAAVGTGLMFSSKVSEPERCPKGEVSAFLPLSAELCSDQKPKIHRQLPVPVSDRRSVSGALRTWGFVKENKLTGSSQFAF